MVAKPHKPSGIIRVSRGVYTYKKDRDANGTYFLILDPSGTCITYLACGREWVDLLLKHLNRK